MRILISGATQGLGQALVLEAARRYPDAEIVGFSRNLANVEALEKYLGKEFPDAADRIHLIQGDIGSPASIARVVSDALEILGQIDVLINNVGLFRFDREVTEIPAKDWELDQAEFAAKYAGDSDYARKELYHQMVRTNYIGNRDLLEAVLAVAAERGHDLRVIDVGSVGVVADFLDVPMPGTSHYGRSKRQLAEHTLGLPQLHDFVRVAVVHPGPFEKSAQLIADEYGDTWAVDVGDVAKHAFDLFDELKSEAVVQGVIAAEDHMFWKGYPAGALDAHNQPGLREHRSRRVPKDRSHFLTKRG